MLNDRNLTSHTYREEYALEIYERLPKHLQAMQRLRSRLIEEIKRAKDT
jgi:hypothetical protein